MGKTTSLRKIIEALAGHYGKADPPVTTDPFQLILLENIAYLVSDQRRNDAFSALSDRVGLRPIDILSASHDELLDIARLGGMHPERRVERLRQIARITLQEFGGDLDSVASQPIAKARRAFKRFPSIGDPGAEKILLFARAHKVLALDSNGLRVLLRVGFAEEQKSYATTYRAMQNALKDELRDDFDWLIKAHHLLRTHGQHLCKNTVPHCPECPIRKLCRYFEQHPESKAALRED